MLRDWGHGRRRYRVERVWNGYYTRLVGVGYWVLGIYTPIPLIIYIIYILYIYYIYFYRIERHKGVLGYKRQKGHNPKT